MPGSLPALAPSPPAAADGVAFADDDADAAVLSAAADPPPAAALGGLRILAPGSGAAAPGAEASGTEGVACASAPIGALAHGQRNRRHTDQPGHTDHIEHDCGGATTPVIRARFADRTARICQI